MKKEISPLYFYQVWFSLNSSSFSWLLALQSRPFVLWSSSLHSRPGSIFHDDRGILDGILSGKYNECLDKWMRWTDRNDHLSALKLSHNALHHSSDRISHMHGVISSYQILIGPHLDEITSPWPYHLVHVVPLYQVDLLQSSAGIETRLESAQLKHKDGYEWFTLSIILYATSLWLLFCDTFLRGPWNCSNLFVFWKSGGPRNLTWSSQACNASNFGYVCESSTICCCKTTWERCLEFMWREYSCI